MIYASIHALMHTSAVSGSVTGGWTIPSERSL